MKKFILPIITLILVALVIILSYVGRKTIDEFELEDITYEEGIVNIYYFWGDGCPKCSQLSRFFNLLESELGEKYNLYKFEVWNDRENASLLSEIATLMDQTVSGVPFLIIGDKVFQGFSTQTEDEIRDAIREQSENNFDIMRTYLNSEEN